MALDSVSESLGWSSRKATARVRASSVWSCGCAAGCAEMTRSDGRGEMTLAPAARSEGSGDAAWRRAASSRRRSLRVVVLAAAFFLALPDMTARRRRKREKTKKEELLCRNSKAGEKKKKLGWHFLPKYNFLFN